MGMEVWLLRRVRCLVTGHATDTTRDAREARFFELHEVAKESRAIPVVAPQLSDDLGMGKGSFGRAKQLEHGDSRRRRAKSRVANVAADVRLERGAHPEKLPSVLANASGALTPQSGMTRPVHRALAFSLKVTLGLQLGGDVGGHRVQRGNRRATQLVPSIDHG